MAEKPQGAKPAVTDSQAVSNASLMRSLASESPEIRKAAIQTLKLMTTEQYDTREQWVGFIGLLEVRPEWQEPKEPNKLPEPLDPK